MGSWWGGKVRQAVGYLRAGVPLSEREALAGWISGEQLALFDSMHVADQRHGLDVVATLRAAGHDDPELLLAGLLHDAGKGPDTGLLSRVSWSLGERYGPWVWQVGGVMPALERGYARLRDHAVRSAELALAAGCSPRTAALIREQAHPADASGRALLLADEAC
jgi:hypothetical protein